MERRLVAILCADVVGYSALMGANESQALETIRRLRHELFEPEVSRFNGQVAKRLGDGWVVEFASVVDAVECGITFQQKSSGSSDPQMRIGIHIGDVVHEDGEIYGDGINIAARLEANCAPGCVLVSDDTKRQISGKIATSFHDNGKIKLKNITQPKRVWSWPRPLIFSKQTYGRRGQKPGVFVKKFEALGNDASELAEALRDDLVTSIARQTALTIIGDEKKADYVISGAARGIKGRWRVSAQLTDCADDVLVWSERYEDTQQDLFELQDRCVFQITGAVRSRITLHQARKITDVSVNDLTVDEMLNRAMLYQYEPVADSWRQSVSLLKIALERDPENWMAMTMLCFNCIAKEHIFGWRKSEAADVQRAQELAHSAHRLNPDSDSVRVANGFMLLYGMKDHNAARIEAEHALFLSPNYYSAHWLLGLVECTGGSVEKGKRHALQAANGNQGDPLLFRSLFGAGIAHLADGEYSTAAGWFLRANRTAPSLAQNVIGLAVSHQLARDTDGAATAVASLIKMEPDFNLKEFCDWPFRNDENTRLFRDALVDAGAPMEPQS